MGSTKDLSKVPRYLLAVRGAPLMALKKPNEIHVNMTEAYRWRHGQLPYMSKHPSPFSVDQHSIIRRARSGCCNTGVPAFHDKKGMVVGE